MHDWGARTNGPPTCQPCSSTVALCEVQQRSWTQAPKQELGCLVLYGPERSIGADLPADNLLRASCTRGVSAAVLRTPEASCFDSSRSSRCGRAQHNMQGCLPRSPIIRGILKGSLDVERKSRRTVSWTRRKATQARPVSEGARSYAQAPAVPSALCSCSYSLSLL
ncbi:hypothetical protein EXIGLDRAFT_452947 [Exidia glandulosa HHB12029]|uniref:Uncharacterized protein n=1 Tax=Exidia glandulosa HHB12029 TaxID=1314781 RepID=A0A165K730_EXIGL|nr:hypothetical protein EXIGLDRAFT_452947 [Exidia glandulosa HHB12029]